MNILRPPCLISSNFASGAWLPSVLSPILLLIVVQ